MHRPCGLSGRRDAASGPPLFATGIGFSGKRTADLVVKEKQGTEAHSSVYRRGRGAPSFLRTWGKGGAFLFLRECASTKEVNRRR